jgi:hypothetical protein
MNMVMVRWWFKASEKLPAHKEQVLVRHEDSIELAYYDKEEGLFKLKNGSRSFRVEDGIEWMETLRGEGL